MEICIENHGLLRSLCEKCVDVRGPLRDMKYGRDKLPADAGSTIVFSLNNDMVPQGKSRFQKETT
jgi:hypothetical protein